MAFLGLLVSLSGICTGLLISLYGFVVENFGFFIGEQILILTAAISLFFGILLYLTYSFIQSFNTIPVFESAIVNFVETMSNIRIKMNIKNQDFLFSDEVSGGILNEGRCMKRKNNQTSKKETKPQNEEVQAKESQIQNIDIFKNENITKETQIQTESHM